MRALNPLITLYILITKKCEGSQNYLAGVGDSDDKLPSNVFQSLFLVLVVLSSSP